MHTIAEMFGLTGKVAVVTGGSMGIGRAIALRLAEAGAHVALVDIDADAAERTRCEIQDAGGVAMCVFADASVAADAEKAIRAVVAELGDVHILVNNAGVYPISAALDLTEEVWDRTLDTNLKGAMFFSQAAARNMIEAGHGGKIINMASIEALHPGNGLAHYGASKAGVVMLTKALGKEFAPYGIQVERHRSRHHRGHPRSDRQQSAGQDGSMRGRAALEGLRGAHTRASHGRGGRYREGRARSRRQCLGLHGGECCARDGRRRSSPDLSGRGANDLQGVCGHG